MNGVILTLVTNFDGRIRYIFLSVHITVKTIVNFTRLMPCMPA